MGNLHVPSLYIQLVPPVDLEMTGTLGHLSGSNGQLRPQKATEAKGFSSGEENCGQAQVLTESLTIHGWDCEYVSYYMLTSPILVLLTCIALRQNSDNFCWDGNEILLQLGSWVTDSQYHKHCIVAANSVGHWHLVDHTPVEYCRAGKPPQTRYFKMCRRTFGTS